MRYAAIAALSVATAGLLSACGVENAAEPAGQPSASVTSSTPADTPSATPSATPSESPSPSTPDRPRDPTGTPSNTCPYTISQVRTALGKAEWGKGPGKAKFTPASAEICQYDAAANGDDYATVQSKRPQANSIQLLSLINQADPVDKEPQICTKELGPTYLVNFSDKSGTRLTWVVEAFGCRRVVATAIRGDNPPVQAAPRQASPQLLKSLGMR